MWSWQSLRWSKIIRSKTSEPAFCSLGNGWGVRLNANLHLVSTLRVSAAIPPLPLYASLTWTEKTSPSQLWNTKIQSLRCSQHPDTKPISSYLNPLHTPTPYFFKIHFNIIFSSTVFSITVLSTSVFQLQRCMYKSASCKLEEVNAKTIRKITARENSFLEWMCSSLDFFLEFIWQRTFLSQMRK